MTFSQPLWIFAGLFSCILLLGFFHYMKKRRQEALAQFVALNLADKLTGNISEQKRRYKNILVILAVFLCFVSLARPQYGYKWVDVKRKGIDLLFGLDTSKSMLAQDIKPNRLRRAHLAILDFVNQLEGDRVGLMPFAGTAYLMCPLTLDYGAFAHSLSAVNTKIIPRGGTNLSEVIQKSLKTLDGSANHKILIILTDGENLEGDAIQAAKDAAKEGLTIYTVGVGTSEGELIPLASLTGKGAAGFIKDSSGNFVTSKLDEKTLTTIAEISGGIYAPLGNSGEGLEKIYQQKLALIPKENLAERRHKIPIERSHIPLAMAFVLLIIDFLINERKNGRKISSLLTARFLRKGVISCLLLALSLGNSGEVQSSEGEKAFENEDFLQASQYYSNRLQIDPDNPELNFNYGTAAFKNNLFDEAIEAFDKALKSDKVVLQQKAYYNRGNSQYSKGAEIEGGDPQATVEAWQQALQSLEAAQELGPEDKNAKHNYEIVKKRLEELQKQMEKQDNQKQQEQQNNEKQKKQGEQKEQKKQGDEKKDPQKQDDKQKKKQNQEKDQDSSEQQTENKPTEKKQAEQQEEKKDADSASPEQQSDAEKDSSVQAIEDQKRRKEGKMTKEEARQLLNTLKNEEKDLNFVPSGGLDDSPARQDW